MSFPDTPRHVAERKKLLGRLERKPDDKWSSSHVRHRTLDALYAYSRYYPRQKEEIDRLKGLYNKVTGPQRAVSSHIGVAFVIVFTSSLPSSLILLELLTL